MNSDVNGLVFAVTSSNHAGTKRNPLPFHLRAMMLQEFSRELSVPSFVYGIEDIGYSEDFASYTLKSIAHASDHSLQLTPENTLVVCSTKVMELYMNLGFQILPAELQDREKEIYAHAMPWDVIVAISKAQSWMNDDFIMSNIHSSSFIILLILPLNAK